jgi:hypothetical protein
MSIINKLDRARIGSRVDSIEVQINTMLKELIELSEHIHDIQVKVTDILAVTNNIDAK